MNKARIELEEQFGENMFDWQWGKVHRSIYPHTPFTKTFLRHLFDRSYPSGGNKRTVHVGGEHDFEYDFNGHHGANIKIINSFGE